MQVWQVETQKFDFMTVDSSNSNCFRQISAKHIRYGSYLNLPFQKQKQCHIFFLRLLEDRFSPQTQSKLGAGTLIHILEKISEFSLFQTNNCG